MARVEYVTLNDGSRVQVGRRAHAEATGAPTYLGGGGRRMYRTYDTEGNFAIRDGGSIVPGSKAHERVMNEFNALPSGFSSEKGAELVTQAQKKENSYTQPPPPAPTPIQSEKQTAPDKSLTITWINPDTGQEIKREYDNADIRRSDIEKFDKSWSIKTAEGYTPDWLRMEGENYAIDEETPEEKALAADRKTYDNLIRQLQNINVDSDPIFQRTVSAIGGVWDARIREMEVANRSRSESLRQTGIRFGSRYTPGMFESVISEEERQGASRVAELMSQRDAALLAARSAFEEKEYNKYVQLINQAESRYKESREALIDLQKAQAEQDKKIKERERTNKISTVVSELLEQEGLTDVGDIYAVMQERGFDGTLKEVSDAFDILNPKEDLAGLSTDYRTYKFMKENGEIPSSWSYIDFETAVSTANRKPDTGDDSSNEFELAQMYVNENPDNFNDEELRAELLRTTKLSGAAITAIIAAKQKGAPPTPDEIKNKVKTVLSANKEIYARDEAKAAAEQQLKDALQLGKDDELPQSYQIAIDDAVVEVYGQSFWQKIFPGGR